MLLPAFIFKKDDKIIELLKGNENPKTLSNGYIYVSQIGRTIWNDIDEEGILYFWVSEGYDCHLCLEYIENTEFSITETEQENVVCLKHTNKRHFCINTTNESVVDFFS